MKNKITVIGLTVPKEKRKRRRTYREAGTEGDKSFPRQPQASSPSNSAQELHRKYVGLVP